MAEKVMNPKISIIIPSYNSAKTIGSVLEAIAAQTRKELISEIIIVDSSDDAVTKEVLERRVVPNVRIISAGTRVMPAVGRNLGAKNPGGDILLFLDSDTCLEKDYIEKVASVCETGARAGGGAILLPDFQRNKLMPLVQYFLQCNEFIDVGGTRKKRFIPSCNVFCERALFEKVGGFPEIRAAEDVMFCLNLIQHEPFWFLPQAKVYHIFREDLGSFFANQALLGEYVLRYRRLAYPEKFYYRGYFAVVFTPAFLVIKFCLITLRILRSRWEYIGKYLVTLPVFLVGLLAWGAGFARGAFRERSH